MSEGSKQVGDKKSGDHRPEDKAHPGMNPDPAERGKQLGEENAYGAHSTGTGGHGKNKGVGPNSDQPVGGMNVPDQSQFTQEQLHPGMNPDPAIRGKELGEENAVGGQSIGTGGHGASGANLKK